MDDGLDKPNPVDTAVLAGKDIVQVKENLDHQSGHSQSGEELASRRDAENSSRKNEIKKLVICFAAYVVYHII